MVSQCGRGSGGKYNGLVVVLVVVFVVVVESFGRRLT